MRRLFVLALTFLLASGARALAQDDGQLTTLRLQTRLVLLDTSVTDAKGVPVLGLTARDFAVYEDKASQQIVSFDTPAAHLLPGNVGKTTKFDAARPEDFGSSPVNILVLDEVNTHFADSVYAVHELESYLKARPETLTQPTSLLVVRDSRFEQLVPFTLDRDLLLHALKVHVPEQAWQLEQSMSAGEGVAVRLDDSLSALEQLVQYSARIPGHKNLVWVGAGFPSVDPAALGLETNRVLQNMLQHVTDVLLDARASLYAIDPTTTAASVTEITDPQQLEFASMAGGGARIMDPFDRSLDFDRLGPVTGGQVIRGLNDLDRQVQTSVTAGSTYYTLGYRPSGESDAPGRFRHIKVVCLRPGLTVTTHDGYYTSGSNTTEARDTISYDLNNAATASVPFNAVMFTVEPEAGKPGSFILHVRSSDLSWKTTDSGQNAKVQVLAVGLSGKGSIVGHTLQSETANAAANVDTRAPDQRVRFVSGTPVTDTMIRLRFVIRDERSGRMGTVDMPVSR